MRHVASASPPRKRLFGPGTTRRRDRGKATDGGQTDRPQSSAREAPGNEPWADAHGVNVRLRTVLPPCFTVMVTLMKLTLVMTTVQLLLGKPACFAVGVGGCGVVTEKKTSPFLTSLAEMG